MTPGRKYLCHASCDQGYRCQFHQGNPSCVTALLCLTVTRHIINPWLVEKNFNDKHSVLLIDIFKIKLNYNPSILFYFCELCLTMNAGISVCLSQAYCLPQEPDIVERWNAHDERTCSVSCEVFWMSGSGQISVNAFIMCSNWLQLH